MIISIGAISRVFRFRLYAVPELVLALLIMLLPGSLSEANAFDSQRKGFLFNAEVGYAPYVNWNVKDSPVSESESSIQFGGLLGYGFNNRSVIGFRYDNTQFRAGYFDFVPDDYRTVRIERFSLVLYRFFRPHFPSLYCFAGAGYLRYETHFGDLDSHGISFLGGAGYQFMQNVGISVVAQPGFSSNRDSLDFTHFQINLEATAWLY